MPEESEPTTKATFPIAGAQWKDVALILNGWQDNPRLVAESLEWVCDTFRLVFKCPVEDKVDESEAEYDDQTLALAEDVTEQDAREFCTQIRYLKKVEGELHRQLKDEYPVFDQIPRNLIANLLVQLKRAEKANFSGSCLPRLWGAFSQYKRVVQPIAIEIYSEFLEPKAAQPENITSHTATRSEERLESGRQVDREIRPWRTGTTNDRITRLVLHTQEPNPEYTMQDVMDWNIREMGNVIDRAPGTISNTEAWQKLQERKAADRAEREHRLRDRSNNSDF